MKKLFITAIAIMAISLNSNAQSFAESRDIIKQRKELAKLSKSEIDQKASKVARKEAKRLKKEGWQAVPGALPMEEQLDRRYRMEKELDAEMMPMYIWGHGQSIGENIDPAKIQALEFATQEMAKQIASEFIAYIKNSAGNQQLAPEQAASIAQTVSESGERIRQSIGRTINVEMLYRVLPNRNTEVSVHIAYSSKVAMNVVKQAIRAELESKAEGLYEEMEKVFSK